MGALCLSLILKQNENKYLFKKINKSGEAPWYSLSPRSPQDLETLLVHKERKCTPAFLLSLAHFKVKCPRVGNLQAALSLVCRPHQTDAAAEQPWNGANDSADLIRLMSENTAMYVQNPEQCLAHSASMILWWWKLKGNETLRMEQADISKANRVVLLKLYLFLYHCICQYWGTDRQSKRSEAWQSGRSDFSEIRENWEMQLLPMKMQTLPALR